MSITQLLGLLEHHHGSKTKLARLVGVSPSTLRRWELGHSTPRPRQEGKLRELAGQIRQASLLGSISRPTREHALRSALVECLKVCREALHSFGSISSRHAALDLISGLIVASLLQYLKEGSALTLAQVDAIAQRDGGGRGQTLSTLIRSILSRHGASSEDPDVDLRGLFPDLGLKDDVLTTHLLTALDELNTHLPERSNTPNPVLFDILNNVFAQVLSDAFSDERQLGQYLTPEEVVQGMVDLVWRDLPSAGREQLLSSDSADFGYILDPSCGVSSFPARMIHTMFMSAKLRMKPSALRDWMKGISSHCVVGIDKSPRMLTYSLASLSLLGADRVQLHLNDALGFGAKDGSAIESLDGKVGLILTNPPFGAEFKVSELTDFQIATRLSGRGKTKNINSELLFVERYLKWLRPGGRVAAVVPDSILANKGVYADLRSIVSGKAEIRSIISLPQTAFEVAGTTTKTSILYLQRSDSPRPVRTYFSMCRSLGFEVVTKSSIRMKVSTDQDELPSIVSDYIGCQNGVDPQNGRVTPGVASQQRWDATFYCSLPSPLQSLVDNPSAPVVRVKAVADLVNERTDPRRNAAPSFKYIEISGIDSTTAMVRASSVPRNKTPSRARKLVKAGDVLVSTVRPNLKTIGVVPGHLDGAVCTTGLAVLRPRSIDPYTLARGLQAQIAVDQMMRHSMGIAYPAIDEAILLEIVLPIEPDKLQRLNEMGGEVRALRHRALQAEQEYQSALAQTEGIWRASIGM